MRFETLSIHAGGAPDEQTGAVAPPLHLATTYEQALDGSSPRGFVYVRDANPTQQRLEEALAAIDGGAAALTFASGMAAGAAIFQSLPPGAHVVLPDDSYYAYRKLAAEYFAQWGLTYVTLPMEDLDAVRAAKASVIWAESPSNPLMKVVDLAALRGLARERDALFVVDGTFATPALQRPIEHGADVVLHSTTKYLGGHSDVQGGALVFARKDDLYERVLRARTLGGGVASPFNSWLVLRGIRSLGARIRVHCENALAIARFLEAHPRVEAVHYPGLASHPRHEIARRQMSAFGGMMSFRVRGGRDAALAVLGKVRIFTRATSLGGVESLIEHRATSEGPGSTAPANLLRLSIGLEHVDDLLDDLSQAL